jgi:cytochrome c553
LKGLERRLVLVLSVIVLFAAVAIGIGWFRPAAVTSAVIVSATGLEMPPLDDPAMIRRGAGHFERNCAGCHASPDRPDRADHLALSPPAPQLHRRIEGWVPEILFAIVKYGVPNSAMPAWPAEGRDDEIWSVVAFLRALPAMEADAYRAWAGLDQDFSTLGAHLIACAQCHGTEGKGTPDGAFPRLDLQGEAYLLQALQAFRDGERESGIMASAVTGLLDHELEALAEHYAAVSAGP